MALVIMEKDEENARQIHRMNTAGEGGRTRPEVTRVMAVLSIEQEARAGNIWSVNGALVAMKWF